MKKLILFTIITLCFITCKRKQILKEPDNGKQVAIYPAQCYNQTKDTNEIAIDCGGPCEACLIAQPSCTFTTNIFNLDANTYTSTATSSIQGSNDYTFNANLSGGITLQVIINGSTLDVTKVYNLNNSASFANDAYFKFSYTPYGSVYSTTTGKLYISNSGNKYKIVICGAIGYSFVTGQSYNVSGSFITF